MGWQRATTSRASSPGRAETRRNGRAITLPEEPCLTLFRCPLSPPVLAPSSRTEHPPRRPTLASISPRTRTLPPPPSPRILQLQHRSTRWPLPPRVPRSIAPCLRSLSPSLPRLLPSRRFGLRVPSVPSPRSFRSEIRDRIERTGAGTADYQSSAAFSGRRSRVTSIFLGERQGTSFRESRSSRGLVPPLQKSFELVFRES